MLPQVNARLLAVATEGRTEDWDTPAGAGPVRWMGDEDAYVTETVQTTFAQDGSAMRKTRDVRLRVTSELADTLTIVTGDVITYRYRNVVHTRQVMEYARPDLPSIPAYMRYTNLHLNPAPLETPLELQ